MQTAIDLYMDRLSFRVLLNAHDLDARFRTAWTVLTKSELYAGGVGTATGGLIDIRRLPESARVAPGVWMPVPKRRMLERFACLALAALPPQIPIAAGTIDGSRELRQRISKVHGVFQVSKGLRFWK